MSLCRYFKGALPTSDETGVGEAATKSANENVQKVLMGQENCKKTEKGLNYLQ